MRGKLLILTRAAALIMPPLSGAFLISPNVAIAQKSVQCSEAFQEFSVPVHRIPGDGSGLVKIQQAFSDQKELLLGITPAGHAYLIVDGIRFDGQIMKYSKRIKKVTTVNEGIVLRFMNMPDQTIETLKSDLKNKKHPSWSTSCFSAACNQLDQSGIQVAGKKTLLPTRFFKNIIRDGFRNSKGAKMDVEVFLIGDHSVASIYRNLKVREDAIVQSIPMGGAGLVVAGSTLYYFYTSMTSETRTP